MRASSFVLILCLAANLSFLGAQDPAVTKLKEQYYQSFKGKPEKSKGWEMMGLDADQCVKFEGAGLRITLPPGHPGTREDTGLVRGWPVKGDFEITVGFEILKEPQTLDSNDSGTRFSLAAALDKPEPERNMTSLSYRVAAKGGDKLVTWVTLRNVTGGKDQPKFNLFPAKGKARRLRLVRSGTELTYYVSEAPEGEDFERLTQYPFGKEDLKFLSIAGSTGSDKAALDVRVTDLLIRAVSLPGSADPAAPPPKTPAAAPNIPAAPAPRAAGNGLPWGWILGIVLALSLALGGWLYVRHRQRAGKMPAPLKGKPGNTEAASKISCICPGCGEKLKAKASLAGKKVKCPQCKEMLLIPGADSSESPSR